jgi:hypothetical protein
MHALNPHAFVINPKNAWLNPSDVPQLGLLTEAYFSQTPCRRVVSALWYFEAAARSYYIDSRWPLLATGLEALVHIRNEKLPTGRYAGSTKVFARRLSSFGSLASELTISEGELRSIYDWRSHLAHGQTFGNIDLARQALYEKMETFMRNVLKKALLDRSFHDLFLTDATIPSVFPL